MFDRRFAVINYRTFAAEYGIVNFDSSYYQTSCDDSPVPKTMLCRKGAVLCRSRSGMNRNRSEIGSEEEKVPATFSDPGARVGSAASAGLTREAEAMQSVTTCSQAARLRLWVNLKQSPCICSLSFDLNGKRLG